jgi:hypothetical protein
VFKKRFASIKNIFIHPCIAQNIFYYWMRARVTTFGGDSGCQGGSFVYIQITDFQVVDRLNVDILEGDVVTISRRQTSEVFFCRQYLPDSTIP